MDADASTSTRIAVLIDCDNVSSDYASLLLEELAKYGTPTVKRAYGDWSEPQLKGWQEKLLGNGIQPMQQFAYVKGKNSTDTALIIDAMDLLWQGNVETFALVSSDSDFTRLATRLRESGKTVYGVGMRKTPLSLRKAVERFIELENLQKPSDVDEAEPLRADESPTSAAGAEAAQPASTINLQSALTKAVNAKSGDDDWAHLAEIGQHLSRVYPDFDPRAFGDQKLSTLVKDQPYLETRGEGSKIKVRLRSKQRAAKKPAVKKPAAKKTPAKKATVKKAAPGRS